MTDHSHEFKKTPDMIELTLEKNPIDWTNDESMLIISTFMLVFVCAIKSKGYNENLISHATMIVSSLLSYAAPRIDVDHLYDWIELKPLLVELIAEVKE